MTLAIQIALCAALILSIFIPGLVFLKGERTKGRFKSALAINLFTFFGLLIIAIGTQRRSRIHRGSTFHRHLLPRRRYRRRKRGFGSARRDQ